MARIFEVLAFFVALNISIGLVNAVSPYSSSYTSPSYTGVAATTVIGGTTTTLYNGQAVGQYAGLGVPNKNGQVNASAGVGLGGQSGGIFGPIVNTIFIFGYFLAAAQFLVNLAGGVFAPGYYINNWLYSAFGDSSSAATVGALYESMVLVSYGLGIIYIISGRYLEH